MKTLSFPLLSALILMSICAHVTAINDDNDVKETEASLADRWPFVWDGHHQIFPIHKPLHVPDRHIRPHFGIPRIPPHDKCLGPIFKVKNCVHEIIVASLSKDFEGISEECCEAVVKVGPNCHFKHFNPQLLKYCSGEVAPPPSTLEEFVL